MEINREQLREDLITLRKDKGFTEERLTSRDKPFIRLITGGENLEFEETKTRFIAAVQSIPNSKYVASLMVAYALQSGYEEVQPLKERRQKYADARGKDIETIRKDEDTALNELVFTLMPEPEVTTKFVTGTSNIYRTGPEFFFGRENEIKEINDVFASGTARIWIHGMGGIGKTQLCRKLFCDFDGVYPLMGWITFDGDLKTSLVENINCEKKIAAGIDKAFDDTMKFISDKRDKLVLFIDNFSGEDYDVLEALPCRTIITSRNAPTDKEAFIIRQLDFLSSEECTELFKHIYRQYRQKVSETELNDLNYIVNQIAYCHALTVKILAHTCAQNTYSIPKLREELSNRRFYMKFDDVDDENTEKMIIRKYQELFNLGSRQD